MLRTLFFVLLFISTSAVAQTWRLVTDSNDGTRLLVDIDTVKVDKYSKGKGAGEGTRISARMSYLANNEEKTFISVIDVNECLDSKSGTLVTILPKGGQNTYFWSSEGNKMYDAQGQWLCGFTIGVLEEMERKKEEKQNTYSF